MLGINGQSEELEGEKVGKKKKKASDDSNPSFPKRFCGGIKKSIKYHIITCHGVFRDVSKY